MLIRTACWVPLLAQTLCAQGLPHGGRGNMKELSSYLEIQKAKKVKGPCFSGFERWPSISISENENTRRESFSPLYLPKQQPSALIPKMTWSQNILSLYVYILPFPRRGCLTICPGSLDPKVLYSAVSLDRNKCFGCPHYHEAVLSPRT